MNRITSVALPRQCLRLFGLNILVLVNFAALSLTAQASSDADRTSADLPGIFVGTTPVGHELRQRLGISASAELDIMQWNLSLFTNPTVGGVNRYELRADYGQSGPNVPGIASNKGSVVRSGTWTIGKGTATDPNAIIYELSGSVSFLKLNDNILHLLASTKRLLVGGGGWSYTLNRKDSAEKTVDLRLLHMQPDMSYRISPLSNGPTVFGVFEGRSPAQGIANVLGLPVDPASVKAKWRLTLFKDPVTLAPTSYKIEGMLYRNGAREGKWTILTTGGSKATIYRLDSSGSDPAIHFLVGDENVLYFLDRNLKPMVGTADFSYTLNRRATN